ncbi:DNA-processing protein DprA [Suttonella ornithocola]|uniref:DNA protecting protein DprA n=1 Tax=Suttonella ornithocola TaxID=279832 RepID=A0A380MQK2_9GAMM|nr:DNA-processing protein DprA [Suttonella ornithocola]SUO94568.1 DNA protecting protein DprA [Suttonella ornithocola]
MEERVKTWCRFNRISGLGIKSGMEILATFGSPEAFFAASDADVRKCLTQIDEKHWQQWRKHAKEVDITLDIEWLEKAENRHIITIDDARYPPLLKEISDPPLLLYVMGEVELLNFPQLGIVGSRQSTQGGEQFCASICANIVEKGIVITSGMALGIDGAAHRGALAAGGKTLAVVGTGLDRVYPARHRELAYQIVENGAIVSEFPIGTGVRQHHFPRRNRIISGLSLGVLVVEASIQSGSLITAKQAAEQGREVFAVPGSVFNPLSKGCHALIREGAKLTESAEDILEELLPLALAGQALLNTANDVENVNIKSVKDSSLPIEAESDLTPEQVQLLSAMGYDPCRVDDLLERLNLTIAEISAMLLMLELDGRVQSLPGGRFQRLN